MKIAYNPPYDPEWGASLSPWQHDTLAALHRQGKHLPDRTDHGSDQRWHQAGCKVRDGYGTWKRNPRESSHYHEGIIISRTDYGFTVTSIRRAKTFLVDPDTGEVTPQEGWTVIGVWYVEPDKSANYPPGTGRKERMAA